MGLSQAKGPNALMAREELLLGTAEERMTGPGRLAEEVSFQLTTPLRPSFASRGWQVAVGLDRSTWTTTTLSHPYFGSIKKKTPGIIRPSRGNFSW